MRHRMKMSRCILQFVFVFFVGGVIFAVCFARADLSFLVALMLALLLLTVSPFCVC